MPVLLRKPKAQAPQAEWQDFYDRAMKLSPEEDFGGWNRMNALHWKRGQEIGPLKTSEEAFQRALQELKAAKDARA